MISNPKHGWCDIEILGWKGDGASYLEDYPLTLSEALLSWTSDGGEQRVKLDFEGLGWVTAVFGPDRLQIIQFDGDGEDDKIVFEFDISQETVGRLRRELASDLEGDFEKWTVWSYDVDDSASRVRRREELERIILALRGSANA